MGIPGIHINTGPKTNFTLTVTSSEKKERKKGWLKRRQENGNSEKV